MPYHEKERFIGVAVPGTRARRRRWGRGRLDSPVAVILKGLGLAVVSSKHNSPSMSLNIMADKDDLLLNSREVAFLLDLSPDTVNELARRNIIPAFKKGRQWRFRKRDITLFKRQFKGLNAAA
jgi:excisionase family DNA binding protein